MWFVYILYSPKIDRYYVGYADDVEWRLQRHNEGWGRYTKAGIPWEVVYTEEYADKQSAMKRERAIKRKKSRKYIEQLCGRRSSR